MFPTHSTSDEELKEISRELESFARALFKGDRKRWALTLKVLTVAAALGLLVGMLVAIGQTLAIGVRPGYALYGRWWILSPVLGAAVPVGYFVIVLLAFGFMERSERAYEVVVAQPVRERLVKLNPALWLTVMGLMLLAAVITAAYDHARRTNDILARHSDSIDLEEAADAAAEQAASLNRLEARTAELLSQFEKMELELNVARQALAGTVKDIRSRTREANGAALRVKRLQSQQRQIELRLGELQRLLDGGAPLTKQDLDRSSRAGLAYGTLLGFVGSIAAAVCYSAISRRLRRRRRPANDNAT